MSKNPNLQPVLHSALVAPVVDTSPQALEFPEAPSGSRLDEAQKDVGSTPNRVKRLSAAVEKTVDKLNKSITNLKSPVTPPPTGHKRMFSLSRKGKGRVQPGDSGDMSPQSVTKTPLASRPSSPALAQPQPSRPSASQDDSPFISPPSPPPTSRPTLIPFRGDGSVRFPTS
ncbi:hypothetical protein BD779DRAFT_1484170 [Infundibulicybe gibba]|nr:hypothetical protein BD779DRAFT_1484170 [Infundibulicybe gibba]